MTNEFKDKKCSIGECENTPTHSLYHSQYHYCNKHYVIIGECEDCNTPIHESWDYCSDTLCRPCGKDRDSKGVRCVSCKGWFPEADMEEDDDGMMCCPCWYYCENCHRPRINHDYSGGICDECNKVLAYCDGEDHDDRTIYKKEKMWRCGNFYYHSRRCCPTTKRRKRIHPPKIAAFNAEVVRFILNFIPSKTDVAAHPEKNSIS
jgi:hypothetical protein